MTLPYDYNFTLSVLFKEDGYGERCKVEGKYLQGYPGDVPKQFSDAKTAHAECQIGNICLK